MTNLTGWMGGIMDPCPRIMDKSLNLVMDRNGRNGWMEWTEMNGMVISNSNKSPLAIKQRTNGNKMDQMEMNGNGNNGNERMEWNQGYPCKTQWYSISCLLWALSIKNTDIYGCGQEQKLSVDRVLSGADGYIVTTGSGIQAMGAVSLLMKPMRKIHQPVFSFDG